MKLSSGVDNTGIEKSIEISKRGQALPASPIRKLIPFADQAKKRGIKIYHLNIGQPDIETPAEFWQAVKGYTSKALAYGNSQGMADYLKKLSAYYQMRPRHRVR